VKARDASENLVSPPNSIWDSGMRIWDLFQSEIRNPESQRGAVAERLMHFTVYEDDDGSSPFSPARLFNLRGGKIYV
jgi:hypothetical protein